jgi:diguanylate cyclase (GGDEF)-like protein
MKTQSLPSGQLGDMLLPADAMSPRDIDLEQVLSDLLRRARMLIPSGAGGVLLRHPSRGTSRATAELVVVACFGPLPDGVAGRVLPVQDGLVRRVYRTGRAHITPSEDHGALTADGIGSLRTPPATAQVCAPLEMGGEPVGVLELLDPVPGPEFTLRELALLEVFGQTVSAWLTVAADGRRSREMATRDDLTGLYNDRHLHRMLMRQVTRALTDDLDLGVVFLDLDRFKEVNDVHGHLAGSRVLAEVGGMLRERVHDPAVAARYGGDEFVVVLPGVDRERCRRFAVSIAREIGERVFLAHADPADPESYPALSLRGHVSCSIGVAMLGDTVASLERPTPAAVKNRLLRAADRSMYRAKALGRDRVVAAWEGPAVDLETHPGAPR